jgi:hypothetical protein
MLIRGYKTDAMMQLRARVRDDLSRGGSLEAVAQRAMDLVYDEFKDSLVLARVYATIPFARLPPFNHDFVRRLCARAHLSPPEEKTPVFSLLGTRGARPEWNDRRASKGHVGVPLLTAQFIDSIPMLASLFRAMGADIHAAPPASLLKHRLAGLFYVEDAKTAVDERGRFVIPAQDFVKENRIRSVFGTGGSYMTSDMFLAALFFSREALSREDAERFANLLSLIKANTVGLVARGRFFEQASGSAAV